MASVENKPLTGGLLLGKNGCPSRHYVLTRARAVWTINLSRILAQKGLIKGTPLAIASMRISCLMLRPVAAPRDDYLRLPDPDNKAGSRNGLWNKTRQ